MGPRFLGKRWRNSASMSEVFFMRAAAHVIPGYRFTLGITFFYLSMILLIPLAADEAQGTGDITYYNDEPVY